MVAFTERAGRGKAPQSVAVRGCGAHQCSVVVQADDGVSLCRAAEHRTGVVGGFSGGDIAGDRTNVIKNAGDNRCGWYPGKRGQRVARRAGIPGGILRANLQRLSADLRRVEGKGEVAGGVGRGGAEHGAAACRDDHRAVGFRNAGQHSTVGVHRKSGGNTRSDGIDHNRRGSRHAAGIARAVRCGNSK